MKRALLILLATFSAATYPQQAPEGTQSSWHNGRFSQQHEQEKQREQLAIGLRVQRYLRVTNDRNEVQYAENRRRCQAALRVAALCGKFAGTFSCDEKGFKPVAADAAATPAVMSNSDRHRMEHCALDAAKRDP